MKEFIDLLLNDSVLFLIAITIIILIILIISFLTLLKKKYELVDSTYMETTDYHDNVSKLNNLINEEEKVEEIKVEIPVEEPMETVVEDNKLNLEDMLSKMEETLNEKDKAIANFEQEQEEKAIISYEELKKAVSQNNNTNVTKVETLEKNPIKVSKEDTIKPIDDNKNFKNTDFISPIYGKMDNNYEYPTISNVEENVNVEKAEKDVVFAKHSKDNNEVFLDSLKQFRRNLE